MNVSLRPVEDRDLDTLFQQVTDPESVRMAAFTAVDQTDRSAFLNRQERLRADTSVCTESSTSTEKPLERSGSSESTTSLR